jgi:protoporphyrinogen oxidase
MKIGILGGGLSGLSLANLLKHDFKILEKERECGGLCRTMQDQGFAFDYGGCHILFSKDTEALNFILNALGENCLRNRRNNKIFYKGYFVKYPFENGLHDLPLEDNFECLYGFVQALIRKERDGERPSKNFKEWCLATFGRGIAEKYLIPYNEKIWKFNPEEMSAHWVEGRVPQPPAEDILKSSIGIETEGYTHQLYYHYPKLGGIQAIIRALEKPIAGRIVTGFEVGAIARDGAGWKVSDGTKSEFFDRIVSTIPVFDLARALGGVPEAVQEAVRGLKYNRLITVLLGLDVPKIKDFTALYIPDKGVLPHRIGFPSTFSPSCAPQGKSSLLVEITCALQDKEPWQSKDQTIIDRVIEDLRQLGIISNKNSVCYSRVMRSQYAYVIYDKAYLKNIQVIYDYFKKLGIILLGRFSEFKYLNMDACVRSAMEKAPEVNKDE